MHHICLIGARVKRETGGLLGQLKLLPERYDITIIGAEPQANCNRILLSSVLAGEKTLDEIVINPRGQDQLRLVHPRAQGDLERYSREHQRGVIMSL